MPDIFDQIPSTGSSGDIFDRVAPAGPERPSVMERLKTGAKNDIQNIFRLITPAADEQSKSFLDEPLTAARQAISRAIPFPGARQAVAYPESIAPENKKLEYLLNPLPEILTDAFSGGVKQVHKVSPDLAKLIEDTMASAPALHGAFATPKTLKGLSGETALRKSVKGQVRPVEAKPVEAVRPIVEAPKADIFDQVQPETPQIAAKVAPVVEAPRVAVEPKPAVEVAPQQPAPMADWLRESIDRQAADAQRLGIADRIEELSAEKKTANEVSRQISAERNGLAGEDVKGMVRAVRSSRGIPSMDQATEFDAWLAGRKPKVREPTAATPAPVEAVAKVPDVFDKIAPSVPEVVKPVEQIAPASRETIAPELAQPSIEQRIAQLEADNARLRAAKPVPTPEAALSPEEVSARGEMQQMLGGKKPRPAQPKLEDSEVAVSTFIKRQGGIDVPNNLKEEFGGWRLHKKGAMGPDEMAVEAHAAGLIPEPTTNALLEGLKSGRKSSRSSEASGIKAQVEAAAADKIKELTDTPADLEFKGKTYQGAVPEGNNVRLKDHPDIVLKKANDILSVDEKVPFDVPAESPKVAVETDTAKRQEIHNSMVEGEHILRSGKKTSGQKMTEGELSIVQRAVDKNRAQLGESQQAEPLAAKRPWEMTRGDFRKELIAEKNAARSAYDSAGGGTQVDVRRTAKQRGQLAARAPSKDPVTRLAGQASAAAQRLVEFDARRNEPGAPSEHRAAVERAIAENKSVSPEVLKDYPDLQPKPMFEQTKAGSQSVIPGAEARSVPNAPLKPKRAQTEKPMALEMPGIEAKEPSLLGILKSERGSINMGPLRIREGKPVEAPTLDEAKKAVDDVVSSRRLIAGGLGEESSKTLSKTMGREGEMMAKLSKAIRNDSELEASGAYQPVKAALKPMNAAQRNNLVDVLEGREAPIDETVRAAAAMTRTELNKVADRAAEVGLQITNPATGDKIPFQPRGNFFPHMFGKELGEVVRDPKSRAMLKDQIKASLGRAGKETTDKAVEQALNDMVAASRKRYGHLEIARITDLGDYSKDPGAVLSRYFSQAYRRINIAEKFGPELQEGEMLLSKIGMSKGDKAESFARSYFQKVTGTEADGNAAVRDGITFATNFQAFSKLGQAVISNLSQPAYTAIVAGAKNAAKGYVSAATKEGRNFADKIILSDTMTDFLKDTGTHIDQSTMGRGADAVLKGTGFTAVERLNRTVAANAGKYFAEDTFAKLSKNPTSASLRKTLEKMNVDVESALERGEMTEKDLLRAGQSIVNRTQFKTDVTEIPLFWASDAGRLLTQFKKFQFKSGQMAKEEILREAKSGNIKPFVRAAAILPVAGVLTTTMKDAVRFGQQTEKERNLADYLAAVGIFGAFTDAFASSGRQPVKGLQYLAGPTLGDAGSAWEAAFIEAPKGNWKPAAKLLSRQIPVVGPSIRQLFNESSSKAPSDETKLLKDLGMQKDRTSDKRMMKELGLR